MSNYHEEEKQKYIKRLRNLTSELPLFLGEFFRSMAQSTSIQTRVGYAYDLKIFFTYILENHKKFKNMGMDIDDLKVSCLDKITSEDIDRFMEYITYYIRPNYQNKNNYLEVQNDEKGKKRKLSAIRSMYKYFYKREKITTNPAAIIDTPKIHIKPIVTLEVNEVANLLDEIESGNKLTEVQKRYHKKLKSRDLALITLLLGTGMRISECIGININDIDFSQNAIKVTRKGGNQVILYFGEEVREALLNYIDKRNSIINGKELDALFISLQGKRLSIRSVQLLVKKYASLVTPLKNISPHKLRSTFGTTLYQETGDIYLVADVLGHADVNTTKRHYAQIEESRRKNVMKYIKLRKD